MFQISIPSVQIVVNSMTFEITPTDEGTVRGYRVSRKTEGRPLEVYVAVGPRVISKVISFIEAHSGTMMPPADQKQVRETLQLLGSPLSLPSGPLTR